MKLIVVCEGRYYAVMVWPEKGKAYIDVHDAVRSFGQLGVVRQVVWAQGSACQLLNMGVLHLQ